MIPLFSKTRAALLAALLAFPALARASLIEIQLNYSNTAGSKIQFDGKSNFTFTPALNNFSVIAGGDASGLLGDITGTYTIGAITKIGSVSTAPVAGTGAFVIHDGFGFDLVGTLTWLDIVQAGTGDWLNTTSSVNITDLTYGGVNSTLQLLAATPSTGSAALAFQFVPAKSLAQLKTMKASTSFNGSLYAVRVPDSGSAVGLLALGLTLVAGTAGFRTLATRRRGEV